MLVLSDDREDGVIWGEIIDTRRVCPLRRNTSFRKAMEIFRSGNPESALKYLKQTIVIAPGYSKALFEMGNCLTQLGEHEEARVRYEQAVLIDPALKELLGK